MRRNHSIITVAALVASLLTAPLAAEPTHRTVQSRDTAVGRLIAEQGNRALLQIRDDLLDALHEQQPAPPRMHVAVAELPPPQP